MNYGKLFGKAAVLLVTLGLVASCQSKPKMLPSSDKSSALGVTIRLVPKVAMFAQNAEIVLFARLTKSGELMSKELIASNYSSGGRVYLMNAEPGIYAPVVAIGPSQQQQQGPVIRNMDELADNVGKSKDGPSLDLAGRAVCFLPKDVVAAGTVTVGENQLVFAGATALKMDSEITGADEVQKHYATFVYKDGLSKVRMLTYVGTKDAFMNDAATATTFRSGASQDFAETAWARLAPMAKGQ